MKERNFEQLRGHAQIIMEVPFSRVQQRFTLGDDPKMIRDYFNKQRDSFDLLATLGLITPKERNEKLAAFRQVCNEYAGSADCISEIDIEAWDKNVEV